MKMKASRILPVLLFSLIFGGVLFFKGTKADMSFGEEDTSAETTVKTYSGSVNGMDWIFIETVSELGTKRQYVKFGDMDRIRIGINEINGGFDQYGTVWILNSDHTLKFRNYDLLPDFDLITFYYIEDITDVEFLVFEGTGRKAILTGYKTLSGEEYSLPSFEEMRDIMEKDDSLVIDSSASASFYIPKDNTANPSVPTPTPEAPSVNTPVPATETPTPSDNKPKGDSKQLKIKTEKKAKVLYEGDTFLGQYTLKKGVLNWKGPKKKGKITGVKMAGFNKKTKKLAWITKKGDGYVMSLKNGKKKKVVKKKAKRFVKSGNFVAKVETTGKPVNLNNK